MSRTDDADAVDEAPTSGESGSGDGGADAASTTVSAPRATASADSPPAASESAGVTPVVSARAMTRPRERSVAVAAQSVAAPPATPA